MSNIKSEAERCLKCKKPLCSMNCPVSTPIPEVMDLFLAGKVREAGEVLFKNNPLTAVTSIVCPHESNCFGHCVLGKKGAPVEFYEIEKYISYFYLDTFEVPEIKKNGHKIAVVGSGPAGLTMAIKMLLKGYDVTIFEEGDKIGGVLRYGIPDFRLPKTIVDKYMKILLDLGVKFRPNTKIGSAIKVEDLLMDGYKAVFIAIGTAVPRKLGLLGETHGNVYFAVNYLKSAESHHLGRNVVVVGAGNVAMDAARTALRRHHSNVTVLNTKADGEMSASRNEVEMATIEGVQFQHLCQAIKLEDDGVVCVRIKKTETEDGKFKYEEDYADTFKIPCDDIILAIGQGPGAEVKESMETDERGFLAANEFGETDIPGVFAAGDIVTGPKTVVQAVAFARETAEKIDEYIKGLK